MSVAEGRSQYGAPRSDIVAKVVKGFPGGISVEGEERGDLSLDLGRMPSSDFHRCNFDVAAFFAALNFW